MTDPVTHPPRVLIFGVGGVGQAITRLLDERGWPVVGALNRAGAKVGQDLGLLTGRVEPVGLAVQDADEIDLADFGADVAVVAVHDLLSVNAAHHARLLEAGLNVICLGAESSYPRGADPAVADEIDRVARTNGVTFTGCGLWDAYRIWTVKVLAGPCTALRGIHHRSVTDVARFGPEVARLAKVGLDPSEVSSADRTDGPGEKSIYRVALHQAVESLELTVASIDLGLEPVTLDEPVEAPGVGSVPAGLCVGTRSTIDITTVEGVKARGDIELRLTRPGESEWMSWTIDGDPPAEMRLEGLDTGHATASSVVNRIPDVIAAPPGLVTVDQMPPMRLHDLNRGGTRP